MATIACNQCGKNLKIPDNAAGKAFKCPQCGNRLSAPSRTGPPAQVRDADANGETPRRKKAAETTSAGPAWLAALGALPVLIILVRGYHWMTDGGGTLWTGQSGQFILALTFLAITVGIAVARLPKASLGAKLAGVIACNVLAFGVFLAFFLNSEPLPPQAAGPVRDPKKELSRFEKPLTQNPVNQPKTDGETPRKEEKEPEIPRKDPAGPDGPFQGLRGEVTELAFSPQSDLLAAGDNDKTVMVWEFPSGKRKAILEEHRRGDGGIQGLAFSPDGKRLYST